MTIQENMSNLFQKFNRFGIWKKVSELSAGMQIAVAEGLPSPSRSFADSLSPSSQPLPNETGFLWDEIVEIKHVGREQVYDIEVEGTHNFVAGHLLSKATGEPLSLAEEKEIIDKDQARAKDFKFGGIIAHNTVIFDGGKVGIGTTSPYAKLSVVGEVAAANFTATSTTARNYFGGDVSIGGYSTAMTAAFTKAQTGVANTATSGTTIACTLGRNPAPGDIVTVAALYYGGTGTTVTSVVDGASNAYTTPANSPSTYDGNAGQIHLAYLLSAPANANNVITITFANTITVAAIWCDDFTVIGGTAAFDSSAKGTGTGTAINSPTIPVNGTSELLYSGASYSNVIQSADSPWVGNEGGVKYGNYAAYSLNRSAGTAVAYTGNNGAGTWSSAGMSFSITTSPQYVKLYIKRNTEGDTLQLQDTDGSCLLDPDSSSITTTCSSDARLKTNIVNAESVLPYLTNIPIKDYTVIASGDRRTGTVAQELLDVGYGDLVSMGPDGYYGVKEISSWKLIKGIQELGLRINGVASSSIDMVATLASTTALSLETVTATTTDQMGLVMTSIQTLTDSINELNLKVSSSTSPTLTSNLIEISSSTADILASSTPSFIARIAGAVSEYIQGATGWIFAKITSTLAIFNRVETQTAAVTQGLEMTDQVTGQIYCVTIKNGDWNKAQGVCASLAMATTTPPIASITPPVATTTLIVATTTSAGQDSTSGNVGTGRPDADVEAVPTASTTPPEVIIPPPIVATTTPPVIGPTSTPEASTLASEPPAPTPATSEPPVVTPPPTEPVPTPEPPLTPTVPIVSTAPTTPPEVIIPPVSEPPAPTPIIP